MVSKLIFRAAAGREYAMDAAVAGAYSGSVRDVARQIVRDHIRDPYLLAMLDDPLLTFDQYTEDADGTGHEAAVSPLADWSTIIEGVQGQTCELGLARLHMGAH